MNLLLYLCSLVSAQAGAAAVLGDYQRSGEDLGTNSSFIQIKAIKECRTRDLYTTPAVIFIARYYKKDILRCLLAQPNQCEVFYQGHSHINDIVISDSYIYVASTSNSILRCDLYIKNSCSTLYTISESCEVLSLSVVDGYLYAFQVNPHNILRCDLNQPDRCQQLFETENLVWSYTQIDKYLYFGQDSGKVKRCSLSAQSSCIEMYSKPNTFDIRSIERTPHSIYIMSWIHDLWNCSLKSDATIDECHQVSVNFNSTWDIALLNDQMYFANEDGVHICAMTNMTYCTRIHDADEKLSYPRIAIAYETYSLQNNIKNEQKTCPPHVKYYESHERDWFAVYVKNGKLYNARGYLVDTTIADEGHSGPAAIFAMSPDGRLLLSNMHSSQQVRTSSFFAGSPVAGAGEMTVINGIIKKMVACDDHYLADADLNKQVIQSLRMQGYMDPIKSQTCGEDDTIELQ